MSISARARAHLRCNVVGYVALFCALTIAPAFAASLPKNSVTTKQIKNGEVKKKDIGLSAVDGGRIADGTVASADLADQGVGPQDLAVDSVGPAAVINDSLGGQEINEGSLDTSVLQARVAGQCTSGFAVRSIAANGGVSCEDLPDGNPTGPAGGVLGGNYPNPTMAPNAVVTSNIVDDTVTGSKIQANTLDNTDIGPNAVQASELAPNTVANSHMADNAIGNAEMADNAVGNAEIADNAIQHNEMADDSVAGAEVINGSLSTNDISLVDNTATIGGATLPANSCTQSDIDTNVTIGNDIIMLTPKFGAAPLGGVVTWPRKNPADAADVFEAVTCNFTGVDSVLPQTIDWALISQP